MFSFELRTGKTHRQIFVDNQRNVVRLPGNHERLLQNTTGPAFHPTHINAYQVAIYVIIACSFVFLGVAFLKNTKVQKCMFKHITGEFAFSSRSCLYTVNYLNAYRLYLEPGNQS